MSIPLDFKFRVFTCPFKNACNLPKIQFLYKIPECKNCTDYAERLRKLKEKILH
ncbi:MAG: hypothetical protein ACFE9I_10950 [Candidatus Hermodarchaeota archaeon]